MGNVSKKGKIWTLLLVGFLTELCLFIFQFKNWTHQKKKFFLNFSNSFRKSKKIKCHKYMNGLTFNTNRFDRDRIIFRPLPYNQFKSMHQYIEVRHFISTNCLTFSSALQWTGEWNWLKQLNAKVKNTVESISAIQNSAYALFTYHVNWKGYRQKTERQTEKKHK